MEELSPTLRLVLCVRESLERGDSVRMGVVEFIESDSSDLRLFLLKRAPTAELKPPLSRELKETEKNVLAVLRRGQEGESILPILKELEIDLLERAELEIEDFTQKLALRSLIPLMLFVFPAYLVLLSGPTLQRLLISLE